MRASEADLIAEAEERRQALQGRDVFVGKPSGAIGHPAGVEAVHLADHAVGREAVDDRDEIGDGGLAVFGKDRELEVAFGLDPPSPQGFPVLQHAEVRVGAPALGRLPLRGPSVFRDRRFRLLAFPSESPPLVDGMKRVHERYRARERNPRGEGALAKALEKRGLRPSFQSDLCEPARQLRKLCLDHGANDNAGARAGQIAAPGPKYES